MSIPVAVRRSAGGERSPEPDLHADLLRKIREGTARIAVIGLGHVGLPTAVLFAEAGYPVAGVDAREDLVRSIASGSLRHDEPAMTARLGTVVGAGSLRVTTGLPAAAKQADVIIICVQTPVTKNRTPDLRFLTRACRLLGAHLSRGHLVVLESTVPPGTTREVASLLEQRSGLTSGTDFWVAHCPERMAPGNGLHELATNPRLIGGLDHAGTQAAASLFGRVSKGEVITTTAGTAELAKLAENTYRAVNIAFANELAVLCEGIGLNVAEVIRLANSHPRVRIHQPGPGVGGPCVPKDPNLLLHAARKNRLRLQVVLAARSTNDRMPVHVGGLIGKALAHLGDRNGTPRVAVLGTAYKAGVSSALGSPSEQVIRELMASGADVVVHDPCSRETFGARAAGTLAEAVTGSDCIVIMTDHDEYKSMDLASLRRVMTAGAAIVDTRRILNPADAAGCGFSYFGLGIGRGP